MENLQLMNDRRNSNARRNISERRTDDRRDEHRDTLESEIRFLRAGASADQILHGDLIDVSPAGLQLLLDEVLQPTDRILVEVRCADDCCFNLTAEVIWVDTGDANRQRTGCELCVKLSRKQRQTLQQFVAAAAPR